MNTQNFTPEQLAKLQGHISERAQTGFDVSLDEETKTMVVPKGQEKISDVFIKPVHQYESVLSNEQIISEKGSLKERYAEIEKEYYNGLNLPTSSPSLKTTSNNSYIDDMGKDTWYVKNISGGVIVLSDLEIVIPKGSVFDLLESASIDECYASKDIRRSIAGTSENPPMLKRLTPEQYFKEIERAVQINKKIEIVRQQEVIKQRQMQVNPNAPYQNNPMPEQQMGPKIRPMVLAKLEKLRLSSDVNPENSQYGMNPSEFIKWVMSEPLTEEELNHIASDPAVSRKHDVKAAVVEKLTIM